MPLIRRARLLAGTSGLAAVLAAASPAHPYLTFALGTAPPPEYRLVVHSSNPASAVSRPEVARMFLKKVSNWPDGRTLTAIDQERASAVRRAFSRDIHHKDSDSIAAYWQTAVFAGRDVPPPIGKSDADVLAFVRANPGAIGYVSGAANVDAPLKVLQVR